MWSTEIWSTHFDKFWQTYKPMKLPPQSRQRTFPSVQKVLSSLPVKPQHPGAITVLTPITMDPFCLFFNFLFTFFVTFFFFFVVLTFLWLSSFTPHPALEIGWDGWVRIYCILWICHNLSFQLLTDLWVISSFRLFLINIYN